MRRTISWIRALLRRPAPPRPGGLSSAQAHVLRQNLRAILDSKKVLAEQRETAA